MTKCFFKCGREANSQHAKDYCHDNVNMPGNRARMCNWCHLAFHQLNNNNTFDWDWMIKKRRKEIIELANELKKKGVKQRC